MTFSDPHLLFPGATSIRNLALTGTSNIITNRPTSVAQLKTLYILNDQ